MPTLKISRSLALLVVLLAGCGRPPGGSSLSPALPSEPGIGILVVTFDALRADALGVYGYPRPTSPRIDAFAREALVFERAYTAAPVTPTSLAGAFTGRLPSRVFRGWRLRATRTLAGAFAAAGYQTAAFLNNVQLTSERDFDRGWDEYRFYRSVPDERVLEEAVTWLLARPPERTFAWIHFLSPHSPYTVRELSAHLYDPDYRGRFEETTRGRFDADDPAEIARIRSLYDGEVYYADHLFGRLLDWLAEAGRLERTLLVLSSDHGEEFKERGGFQHQRLYEETIRVPLLIRHPRGASGRTRALYSHVDLLPTLAAVAGVAVDGPLDGVNLLAGADPDRAVVSIAMTDRDYRGVSLTRERTKLISSCYPVRELELYDLVEDPREQRNLVAERPSETAALAGRLDEVFGADPCAAVERAAAGRSATEGLDPANVGRLRELGYVD